MNIEEVLLGIVFIIIGSVVFYPLLSNEYAKYTFFFGILVIGIFLIGHGLFSGKGKNHIFSL